MCNTHHIHVKILQHASFIMREKKKIKHRECEFLPDSLGSCAASPPSACPSLSCALTEAEENICVFTALNAEKLQIPHLKLARGTDSVRVLYLLYELSES